MLTTVFAQFQQEREEDYEIRHLKQVREAKAKAEAESGLTMDMMYPQDGGTTATALLLEDNMVHLAWVGDSKAVLGRFGIGAGYVRGFVCFL
jgi:serine/threonine protein phosphatase PrpC